MKTVVFLGNTCNYSFIYHKKVKSFSKIQSISIVDYYGIERDFPSWFEQDFYKIPGVFLLNGKKKISRVYFLWNLLRKKGKKNVSFHCFGLFSCFIPLLLGAKFIYHGYGDILSTPFKENAKIKTIVRAYLAKLSLKYAKYIVVSQSTDIPYLNFFNVKKNKIKYIPLINDELALTSKKTFDNLDSLFNDNNVIFVPTRHSEIKQLDIFIDSLINVFEEHSSRFNENNIRIVFIKWGELWERHKERLKKHEIGKYINWIELQNRDNLLKFISKSYIVVNEFTDPEKYPGFIGGITREAMSLAKPVITHYSFIHDHLFHSTRPPLFEFENNVYSLEKVLKEVILLENDELLKLGKELNSWYQKEYHTETLINKTINLHFE